MNGRERVLTAYMHKEPDRVPLDHGGALTCTFSKGFYEKLLKHLGVSEQIKIGDKIANTVIASEEVLKKLGCDVIACDFPVTIPKMPVSREWEDDASYFTTDNWGITYRMPKSQMLYFDILKSPMSDAEEEDDKLYQWPLPPEIGDGAGQYARAMQQKGFATAPVAGYGNGFLQQGARLYGFETWLSMLLIDEGRIRGFMDRLLEYKMQWWSRAFEACGDAIDIACEADDLGMQTGPMVSPELLRTLIIPYHKKLYAHIKKVSKGKAKTFLHCCGSVVKFLPDLIEAGLDIINPVQLSADGMNPYELKKQFGKDIVFHGGGVDTQYVLPHGTKREVEYEVRKNIDALAPGGGFVFATVHNIQADVPIENFITMHETFMRYSKY